jgi:uncharacterized phage infection (PIP) family protein YhgE
MPFTQGVRTMPNDLATQTEPEAGKLAMPLLERMDPAIGETTSVLGAIMTEFLRRTLRGGVLQIGKELHTFVDEKVDAAIVDRAPALERTAAEVAEHTARSAATEVAHEEVRALESRTRDAQENLATRIQEATRQAQATTQETAKTLTSRIDEARKQAQDVVVDTAKGLVMQIKEAAKRVGENAHAEVTQKVEDLHERSRQSYAQVHERLDAHNKTSQSLKAEIQKLTNQLRSVNDRLAELEKPRGIRAWLGRMFGRGKPKVPEMSDTPRNTLEAAPKEVAS